MSDQNQLSVPPSFIGLFLKPGQIKPNASQAEIAARYELCEDLATVLSEHAATTLWEHDATQADVLGRIHRGLLDGNAAVTAAEAQWVVRRLAELLQWRDPTFES